MEYYQQIYSKYSHLHHIIISNYSGSRKLEQADSNGKNGETLTLVNKWLQREVRKKTAFTYHKINTVCSEQGTDN